jgi:hypothetical protein
MPIKNMKLGDLEPAANSTARRKVELQQAFPAMPPGRS